MYRTVIGNNRPAGGVIPAAFTMKKALKKLFAWLRAVERSTDAAFAGMEENRRREILQFINDSQY